MFVSDSTEVKYRLIAVIMQADAQRIGRRGDFQNAEHLQALEDCFVYQRTTGCDLGSAINFHFGGRLRNQLLYSLEA